MHTKRNKGLFTIIELLAVIVVIGILAAIVVTNTSSVRENSVATAIASDTVSIQAAIDRHHIDHNKLPVEGEVKLGEPKIIDFNKLGNKYLTSKPKTGYYWVDYNNEVHGSTVDAPPNLTITEKGDLTWSEVKDAEKYQVFKVVEGTQSNANGKKVESVAIVDKNIYGNADKETEYLVSSQDKYGNWTPPVNGNYTPVKGFPTRVENIDFEESIGEEQIRTFSLNNLRELVNITSEEGNVEILSVEDNEVTVKFTGGKPLSTEVIEGELVPADTKFVTEQASKEYSDDEGYVGTLEKYLHSGEYIPANTKYVTEQESKDYSDEEGYVGTLEKYLHSGKFTPEEKKDVTNQPSENYEDADGFKGKLEKYVHSGKFTPEDTKFVTEQDSKNYSDKDGYVGTLEKYVHSGKYTPEERKNVTNQPSASYNKDGFSGTLEKYLHSGELTPAHTKFVTNQPSASYDKDGYKGTLKKYVHSGEYIPADTKFVTNQSSASYNKDGYKGTLEKYVHSGEYIPERSIEHTHTWYTSTPVRTINRQMHNNLTPTRQYTSTSGYSGTLSKQNVEVETHPQAITITYTVHYHFNTKSDENKLIENNEGTVLPDFKEKFGAKNADQYGDHYDHNPVLVGAEYGGPTEVGEFELDGRINKYKRPVKYTILVDGFTYRATYKGTITRPESDTRVYRYQGDVTKPEVDTRVYRYEGNVTKPESDTRVYRYRGEVVKPEVDTRVYKYKGNVTRPESDTRVYRYKGVVTKPESDTRVYKYQGEVTKPEVDTRVYLYEGNVTRPEKDTRVYGDVYRYNLKVEYK